RLADVAHRRALAEDSTSRFRVFQSTGAERRARGEGARDEGRRRQGAHRKRRAIRGIPRWPGRSDVVVGRDVPAEPDGGPLADALRDAARCEGARDAPPRAADADSAPHRPGAGAYAPSSGNDGSKPLNDGCEPLERVEAVAETFEPVL